MSSIFDGAFRVIIVSNSFEAVSISKTGAENILSLSDDEVVEFRELNDNQGW